ncbi:uncharacterized protein LOC119687993 [Teleopsis dalmanni]|uniref:uncharacterized protein LOC119687993 n=1 Tax=Teleopsis dalmanni TaxID=139649 RepID=UPI0018CEF7FF|nr:uncharacterized protein LOC119687993 [Teleopsis dalmanni]
MDLRRFGNGGGDADGSNFMIHRTPNYYNLPLLDRCHFQLRQQIGIPLSAFEVAPSANIGRSQTFVALGFKEEYSRMHRVKQLKFQRKLDILVQSRYKQRKNDLFLEIYGIGQVEPH